VPVRCLRCGATVEGLRQFCDDCAATQPRSIYDSPPPPGEPAVLAAGGAPSPAPGTGDHCPRCGSLIPQSSAFCPACGTAVAGLSPSEMLYAGFWMRFLAAIVDGIVVGLAVNLPIGLLVDSLGLAFLLQTVAGAVYTLGFWMAKGATPGKMALNMEIVMADGRPLTGSAAVLRYIGYIVNVATLGIGYLMIAFTPQKRDCTTISPARWSSVRVSRAYLAPTSVIRLPSGRRDRRRPGAGPWLRRCGGRPRTRARRAAVRWAGA